MYPDHVKEGYKQMLMSRLKKPRIFRVRALEIESGRRMKEILGGKLRKPLSVEEVARLSRVPFEVLMEQMEDPEVNRIKTPIGDFLKYERNEYNIYDPRIDAKVVVPKTTRLKFIKEKAVSVNLNR